MKGLEALERLMSKYNEMCLDTGCNDDEYQNGNTTSERAVIEKELRAFEIIKNKGIDIITLEAHEKAKTYNEHTKFAYCKDYTDEEFDLLKEVMK